MSDLPLVSCIMPTCDRRDFVPLAIRFFLRQDYEHRELIVVDDGTDAIKDLIPNDERVRYFSRTRKQSIGAKRNFACEQARGELIAHWDDDDWIAAWRLSYQVEHLLREDTDICGLSQLVFFDPRLGEAWKYVYPKSNKPWVAGGTMCYRKRLWDQQPFEDINNGEDTRYVWKMRGHRVLALPDGDFYAAVIHEGNTISKRRESDRWRSYEIERVKQQLAEDWRIYGENSIRSTTVNHAVARSVTAENVRFDELLHRSNVAWDGWAISPTLGRELDRYLSDFQPKRILEIGSGTSTAVFARHAKYSGAHVVALEHDPIFHAATSRMLTDLGLEQDTDLRLAPLGPIDIPKDAKDRFSTDALWYQTELDGEFDFVFIDGPPFSFGRRAVMFAVASCLADGCQIWLKDGFRSHERECVALWNEHFQFSQELTSFDPRGVWRISPLKSDATLRDAPKSKTTTSSSDLPLVSCIMVTADRPRFARQAVNYFLRQDYPNKELIIVDDGTLSSEMLARDAPLVHYHRIEGKRTTGEKRNLGCQNAHGEIIACWDDDDWFAPDRLSYQVGPLISGDADATGLTQSLLFTVDDGRFWRCSTDLSRRMFFKEMLCGTLVFWARLWGDVRYPDISMAEDVDFVRRLIARRFRIQPTPSLGRFVYVRHGGNTWQFGAGQTLDSRGWTSVPAPTFMPRNDLDHYSQIRTDRAKLKEV